MQPTISFMALAFGLITATSAASIPCIANVNGFPPETRLDAEKFLCSQTGGNPFQSTPTPAGSKSTSSSPASAPSSNNGAVDGHLFVCDTWNFQGNCQSIGFADNTCQNFPSTFQDTISSIRPDSGWNCQAFGNNDCNDNQGTLTVSAPGISQMTTMNDALSSFKCLRQ